MGHPRPPSYTSKPGAFPHNKPTRPAGATPATAKSQNQSCPACASPAALLLQARHHIKSHGFAATTLTTPSQSTLPCQHSTSPAQHSTCGGKLSLLNLRPELCPCAASFTQHPSVQHSASFSPAHHAQTISYYPKGPAASSLGQYM